MALKKREQVPFLLDKTSIIHTHASFVSGLVH